MSNAANTPSRFPTVAPTVAAAPTLESLELAALLSATLRTAAGALAFSLRRF